MLEFLLPCLMLYCLFKLKSKIKIFIAYLVFYFMPIFIMVHDGEKSDLDMARSMGENISTLKWYLAISMMSLMWSLMIFLATLVIFFLLKLIIKNVK